MKLTRDYVIHTRTGIGHCFLGPQNACGRLLYNCPDLVPISPQRALGLQIQGRFCKRCRKVLDRDDRITLLEQYARDGAGDRS